MFCGVTSSKLHKCLGDVGIAVEAVFILDSSPVGESECSLNFPLKTEEKGKYSNTFQKQLVPPCSKQPKLLVEISISRLAILVKPDNSMHTPYSWLVIQSITIGVMAVYLQPRIDAYRLNRARAAELAREEAAIRAVEEGEAGYENTDDTLPGPQETTRLIPTTGNGDVSQGGTQVDNGYGGAYSGNAKTSKSSKD